MCRQLSEPRSEQGGEKARLTENQPHCLASHECQNITFYFTKNITIAVKVDVDIERGSELHERVKAYARENGIRHPRAYRELIEKGLEADGNSN